MRIYDPRNGKFLSVDPLTRDYPWYTPYQFAGNTPIQAIDLDGLEPSYVYQNSQGQVLETPAGDNLARNRLPAGHEQFMRNSFSFPSQEEIRERISSTLNYVPFLGEFKGAWESVSGEEWVTNRKLSAEERMLGLLPVKIKIKGAANAVVKSEVKQVVKAEEAVLKEGKQTSAAHSGNPGAEKANTAGRNAPGTATGTGVDVKGQWLKGTDGNAGLVPSSVAEKLAGQKFADFDAFREAFWQTVAADKTLANQFTASNISRMQKGLAPIATKSQQVGEQISYILHHRTPIAQGGAVFDVNNIMVVTPRYHQEVLTPTYHYNK